MKIERMKKSPDFTENEFQHFLEDYLNGAYYPKSSVEISKISCISKDTTGENGEFVTVSPIYVKYILPSFIVESNESFISEGRLSVKSSSSNIYCFLPFADYSDQGYICHNALFYLGNEFTGTYILPLFYSRRDMLAVSRAKVISPWKYDEESIFTRKNRGERQILTKIPLLKECAVIHPHSAIEEKSERFYYSYDSLGDVCFHGHDIVKMKKQDDFRMNVFLDGFFSSPQKEFTLVEFTDRFFQLLPDLFSLKWTSRKIKFIVEQEIFRIIDEKSVPSSMSFNGLFDDLSVFEKAVIAEKILSLHFGIEQYFRFKIKK